MQAADGAATPADRGELFRHPLTLWVGFAIVHTVLNLLCLHAQGWPLGDVEAVYKLWVAQSANGGSQVGIDEPVGIPDPRLHPDGAREPARAGAVRAGLARPRDPVQRRAFAVLIGGITRRLPDSAADYRRVVVARLPAPARTGRPGADRRGHRADRHRGLILLVSRPLWAVALLTIATWVKVWPAAAIAALFVVSKQRWRVAAVAAGTSAVIVLIALILGSGLTVFSFVTEQTARGIQIESPVAVVWMWQAALGVPGSFLYYDPDILTFQVTGPGIDQAVALMTPLLALAAAAVLLLGWLAMRAAPRSTACSRRCCSPSSSR